VLLLGSSHSRGHALTVGSSEDVAEVLDLFAGQRVIDAISYESLELSSLMRHHRCLRRRDDIPERIVLLTNDVGFELWNDYGHCGFFGRHPFYSF
jgi:hypothetical protein